MATVFLTILKRRKREWSKGTSTPGERLDALSTVGEVEAFIKQAILQKRGGTGPSTIYVSVAPPIFGLLTPTSLHSLLPSTHRRCLE